MFPTSAPQRIVSLVPNISEMLGTLGLQGRVVGIDYYTNYPANLTSLPKVLYVNGKYNVEQIVTLKPDLVLSYGEDTRQFARELCSLVNNEDSDPKAWLKGVTRRRAGFAYTNPLIGIELPVTSGHTTRGKFWIGTYSSRNHHADSFERYWPVPFCATVGPHC